MTSSLCGSCVNSIRCETWGEWKCVAKELRIYDPVIYCKDYKKRGKDFKEPKCQCEDCLKNDLLAEEETEDA